MPSASMRTRFSARSAMPEPLASTIGVGSEQAQVVVGLAPWVRGLEAIQQLHHVLAPGADQVANQRLHALLLLLGELDAVGRDPHRRRRVIAADPHPGITQCARDAVPPPDRQILGSGNAQLHSGSVANAAVNVAVTPSRSEAVARLGSPAIASRVSRYSRSPAALRARQRCPRPTELRPELVPNEDTSKCSQISTTWPSLSRKTMQLATSKFLPVAPRGRAERRPGSPSSCAEQASSPARKPPPLPCPSRPR